MVLLYSSSKISGIKYTTEIKIPDIFSGKYNNKKI